MPELTLEGLRAELAGRGIKVSYGAMQKFVRRIGLSFKKTAVASEQDRPGECPILCVSVICSMLLERSKDDDDFQRGTGRTSEGLRAA